MVVVRAFGEASWWVLSHRVAGLAYVSDTTPFGHTPRHHSRIEQCLLCALTLSLVRIASSASLPSDVAWDGLRKRNHLGSPHETDSSSPERPLPLKLSAGPGETRKRGPGKDTVEGGRTSQGAVKVGKSVPGP